MERGKSISVQDFGKVSTVLPPSTAFENPVLGVVLQDNFSSDEDREEFMQTITSHGITFLRCANSPLQPPTEDDLSLLEKLAKVLSGVWSDPNKLGRRHVK